MSAVIPDELYPFQGEGVEFVLGRRKPNAGLLYEMGLGKTAIAIVAAALQDRKRIFVACPAVAAINWQREFRMWWTGRPITTEIATSRSVPTADVVICSYGLLTNHAYAMPRHLREVSWDLVIADEGQFLKTPTSGRTECMYGRMAQGLDGITTKAADTWVLSGTLTPNHIGELYTHLSALWPLMITGGTTKMQHWQFLQRYAVCRETMYGTQVIGSKNLHELKPKFKQVAIKRSKAQVLPDLPPLDFKVLPIKANTRMLTAAANENEHVARVVDDLDSLLAAAEDDDVAALLDAFSDQLSTLRKAIGAVKLKPVGDLIQDRIQSGLPKLIVFAWHVDLLESLHRRFEKSSVLLHGQSPKRQQAIDRFQTDPNVRVFFGQIQACGTAITLTAASRVLFAESSWVPADNLQAACRAHRIGQKDGVLAEFVTLVDSIDEPLANVLRRKTADLARTWEGMAA